MAEAIGKTWKEIAVGFLKVGATAYGRPPASCRPSSSCSASCRCSSASGPSAGRAAMQGGSVFGVLRDRLGDLPGLRALLCGAAWGR